MNCEYVREHYGVTAVIGRRVIVAGKPGIIAEDRGHYIGVNFDCDKPGIISNAHPTWGITYLDMGKVRKMSKSQMRYKRYLDIGECFNNFRDFLAYECAREKEGCEA